MRAEEVEQGHPVAAVAALDQLTVGEAQPQREGVVAGPAVDGHPAAHVAQAVVAVAAVQVVQATAAVEVVVARVAPERVVAGPTLAVERLADEVVAAPAADLVAPAVADELLGEVGAEQVVGAIRAMLPSRDRVSSARSGSSSIPNASETASRKAGLPSVILVRPLVRPDPGRRRRPAR